MESLGVFELVFAAIVLMFAGSWIGERLGIRISQEAFSQLMALLLMLTGASLLTK